MSYTNTLRNHLNRSRRRSPLRRSRSRRRSPLRRSRSLRRSPLRRSPLNRSPLRRPLNRSRRRSPLRRSPLRRSPLRYRSPLRRRLLKRIGGADADLDAALQASLREYEDEIRMPESQRLITVFDESLTGNVVRLPKSYLSSLERGNCPTPWIISVFNEINGKSVYVTLDTETCDENMITISREVAANLGVPDFLICDLLLGIPKGIKIKFTPQDQTFFTHLGVSNDAVLELLSNALSSYRYQVLYQGQVILLNLPLVYGGMREFPILIEEVTPNEGLGIIDINGIDLTLELNDIYAEERQQYDHNLRRVQRRVKDIQTARRVEQIQRQIDGALMADEHRHRRDRLELPEHATDSQCDEVEAGLKLSLGLDEDATNEDLELVMEENKRRDARLARFDQ